MKETILFCIWFAIASEGVFGQENVITSEAGLYGGYSTSDNIPLWLRSNQNGDFPGGGISYGILGIFSKDYGKNDPRSFDWSACLEGRINLGQRSDFRLIQGNARAKLSVIELSAGRSRDITGLCDTLLSSGSFSVSGNALGIPKLEISIPEFFILPFFDGLLAIKGDFSHGWLGKTDLRNLEYKELFLDSYFHQKSLYGRLGRNASKAKFYGGMNHQVFWGSENEIYESGFALSKLETFVYVFIGKNYGTDDIPTSKIGNHLGSIDLAFEYDFRMIRLFAYRQNFYDFGKVFNPRNYKDGLSGLKIINKQYIGKDIQLKGILFEFLNTRNFSGVRGDSEVQDYYNNFQYIKGWSYKGIGLGTPFISQKNLTRDGLASDDNYFINNRVKAYHLGSEGSFLGLDYIAKMSYSKNFGTYKTSEVYNTFNEIGQFSGMIRLSRNLGNGLEICVLTAFDCGKLYNNSSGLIVGISKELF
jgi:hypothetical protein